MKFPGLTGRVGIRQINQLQDAGYCPCGRIISGVCFSWDRGRRELSLSHFGFSHRWVMPAGNPRNTRYTFAGTWGEDRYGEWRQLDKPWPPIVVNSTSTTVSFTP